MSQSRDTVLTGSVAVDQADRFSRCRLSSLEQLAYPLRTPGARFRWTEAIPWCLDDPEGALGSLMAVGGPRMGEDGGGNDVPPAEEAGEDGGGNDVPATEAGRDGEDGGGNDVPPPTEEVRR